MWFDYIKIRGYDGIRSSEDIDPGLFEVFQGIGPSTDGNGGGGGGGGGEEQPYAPVDIEALEKWLKAINDWVEKEEKWIDDTIIWSEQEGSRGDLPTPIPPQLPDITEFLSLPALIGQFGPWGIVIWVGIKVAKRILEAWIEKKMNPGVGDLKQMLQDIRDALKKGLLYNDGTDSTLLKAFLDTEFKSYLRGLPDLAYVDEIIDFGAFRCHIKGKMIEY